MVYKKGNRLDLGAKPPREFVDRPPPPPRGGNARSPRDLLPGIALKESMGSRRHCSFQYPFLAKRPFFLKSKLKNKKKIVGTKNITVDCSSSIFTAQTDALFKTLKGKMVTTLNRQHIPI